MKKFSLISPGSTLHDFLQEFSLTFIKLSTMVGENFEIYSSQLAKNALKIILYKARNGIKIFWWTKTKILPDPTSISLTLGKTDFLPDFSLTFGAAFYSPWLLQTPGNPVIVRLARNTNIGLFWFMVEYIPAYIL